MSSDHFATGSVSASGIAHLAGSAVAANAAPHHVTPQALKKVELSAPPTSNIRFDRSAMERSLRDAIKLLNDQMSSQTQGLGFHYDDTTKAPVVTVRNLETGQVVRQIPSSDLLRLAHRLDELKGILYNAKA